MKAKTPGMTAMTMAAKVAVGAGVAMMEKASLTIRAAIANRTVTVIPVGMEIQVGMTMTDPGSKRVPA